MPAGGDNGAGVCWLWSERESKKRQLYLLGGGMPEYILEKLDDKGFEFLLEVIGEDDYVNWDYGVECNRLTINF